jgi:hypothetical protein
MKRLWRTLVAGAGVLAASPARGIDRADRDWLLRGPDLEPAAEGVLTVSIRYRWRPDPSLPPTASLTARVSASF